MVDTSSIQAITRHSEMDWSRIEALLNRHQAHGPRYTSYPTAPHFSRSFGQEAYQEALRASNEELVPKPLSLYLHIPFCHSLCYYCGCNKIVTPDLDKGRAYLEELYQEIALRSQGFARDRLVRQIHFGGGTPNFLRPHQLREVLDTLARNFHFDLPQEMELGIEIDPRWVSPEDIRELAGYGFNRMSFGIQDFDADVQRAVNRLQSFEDVRQLIEMARACHVPSVSVDLIYGLPRQSLDSFKKTLNQVIELAPDRVSLYSYAHMPDKIKSQRFIRDEDLLKGSDKLGLFLMALKHFGDAGYEYIGMDHFARPDDPLVAAKEEGSLQRNFQGYSTHGGCDIVGMGVSAISRIGDAYSQNESNLSAYQNAISQGALPIERGVALNRDDRIREQAIQSIMCRGELDLLSLGRHFDMDAKAYFAKEWQQLLSLEHEGLLTLSEEGLMATETGSLFLRNIAMVFDAYSPQQQVSFKGRPLFSTTV